MNREILYIVADASYDIDLMMGIRLEMLRVVNQLAEDYVFSKELMDNSRDYFASNCHTTILARHKEEVIGCASLCYFDMMPTFSHPRGKRAHLMNVYTNSNYRNQGIANNMLDMLIEEAKKQGVSEISLDATNLGRPLYRKCGFHDSLECMVMNINDK